MTAQSLPVTFESAAGVRLAARLEQPAGAAAGYALFAHCFTCGKDIAAASRISRALAARGIAVLRFDFTGLGGSDGDFANTDFSSNVNDLVSAADYLRAEHRAPVLLIGHSLGGAAVLAAADRIPESRAVVTIGAPASPAHVLQQFGDATGRIREDGRATVDLAGRPFTVRREFLEDVESQSLDRHIRGLGRALLLFHSPVDRVVSIDEAAHIYGQAMHPKSFVSLDQADHLLSRAEDASYVAETMAAWASRYLPADESGKGTDVRPRKGEVRVTEANRRFLRDVVTDGHRFLADEPRSAGGDDAGPDPYELLLAALGACTSMTIRMYANRKEWPLDDVGVRLVHDREYPADCRDCDDAAAKVSVITRYVSLSGSLSQNQRDRLMAVADRCPVHRTLMNLDRIETREGE